MQRVIFLIGITLVVSFLATSCSARAMGARQRPVRDQEERDSDPYGYEDPYDWNEFNYQYVGDFLDEIEDSEGPAESSEHEHSRDEATVNEKNNERNIEDDEKVHEEIIDATTLATETDADNDETPADNHNDDNYDDDDDDSNDTSREPEVAGDFGWGDSIADWDYGGRQVDDESYDVTDLRLIGDQENETSDEYQDWYEKNIQGTDGYHYEEYRPLPNRRAELQRQTRRSGGSSRRNRNKNKSRLHLAGRPNRPGV